MIKKWITFTKPQFAWLEKRAKTYGVSLAECVRRIIDDYRLRVNKEDIKADN